MINKTLYVDQPCERCGSKKRINIIQKVTTPALINAAKIEYSQIICTNEVCQREFERKLLEKMQKDEALMLKRKQEKAARKVQS